MSSLSLVTWTLDFKSTKQFSLYWSKICAIIGCLLVQNWSLLEPIFFNWIDGLKLIFPSVPVQNSFSISGVTNENVPFHRHSQHQNALRHERRHFNDRSEGVLYHNNFPQKWVWVIRFAVNHCTIPTWLKIWLFTKVSFFPLIHNIVIRSMKKRKTWLEWTTSQFKISTFPQFNKTSNWLDCWCQQQLLNTSGLLCTNTT